jgi:hypothetical protein
MTDVPRPLSDALSGSPAAELAALVAERRRALDRTPRGGEPVLEPALGDETARLDAAHRRALELLAAAEESHDPD